MMPLSPPPSLQIRPMRLEDIPRVVQIDQLSFSMPWPEKSYRFELTQNPGSKLWVAECSNPLQVVGMIVMWLIIDEAHIATIAVHPDFRRQGIAARLLTTALLDAVQNQMAQATLEVRAGNQAAHDLYQNFGFRVVGIRPHYYRDNNEDAWIMTMSPLDLDVIRQIKTLQA
jgi:[ribosomal protein S18]-alanine N-acetyltransferase